MALFDLAVCWVFEVGVAGVMRVGCVFGFSSVRLVGW